MGLSGLKCPKMRRINSHSRGNFQCILCVWASNGGFGRRWSKSTGRSNWHQLRKWSALSRAIFAILQPTRRATFPACPGLAPCRSHLRTVQLIAFRHTRGGPRIACLSRRPAGCRPARSSLRPVGSGWGPGPPHMHWLVGPGLKPPHPALVNPLPPGGCCVVLADTVSIARREVLTMHQLTCRKGGGVVFG